MGIDDDGQVYYGPPMTDDPPISTTLACRIDLSRIDQQMTILPPIRLPPDDSLRHALAQHRLWLDSEGRSGERLTLRGTRLQHVDLTGCDLSHAHLESVYFKNCWLSDTRFVGSYLRYATFDRCVMNDVDFSEACLMDVIQSECEALGHLYTGAAMNNFRSNMPTPRRDSRGRPVGSPSEWGWTGRFWDDSGMPPGGFEPT